MSDDIKLVPMTRAMRDRLGSCFEHMIAGEIQAAWDAAPADPRTVVKLALIECDGYDEDAVLAALGYESVGQED